VAVSSQQEAIERLDREYDRSEGFLGRLRAGSFDPVGAERLLGVLSSLDLGEDPVDKRLVQLLWFTPIFMQWQKERFELAGSDVDAVESTLNQVVSILEEVVGVP
jgi:hypothetical protein